MIPLPLIDGDVLLLDNSTLELFQTCPRAAQYGICHRRRANADRVPLRFGGIAHKVLEVRYRSDVPMYEQTPPVQAAMLKTAEHEFTNFTPPEGEYRNFDRMVDLIQRYGQAYPFESFDIVKFPDGRPFIEVPFAIPLGELVVNETMWVQDLHREPNGDIVKRGEPYQKAVGVIRIVWQGRIDLAYTYNGGLYIMDHKTSSIATNMAEFEISHQFYGYQYAVEFLLNTQCSGTVINRIVCRRPTRTGEAFTFERKLIPTQRGLISEWKVDTLHMVADFVEMVRRGYMPKHTVWCVGKFGTCQFHKICSNDDPEQREFLLNSGEYEDNVWSPLKETA